MTENELAIEIIKLQEACRRNTEMIALQGSNQIEQHRSNADAITRIHARIDTDKVDLGQCKVSAETRVNAIDQEVSKFKNIGFGLSIAGVVVFSMAQYIVQMKNTELTEKLSAVTASDMKTTAVIDNMMHRLADLEAMAIQHGQGTK